jgi:phosphatidylinositol-3-phosphatase
VKARWFHGSHRFLARPAVALVLLFIGASSAITVVLLTRGSAAARSCVAARPPARYTHVVWIFMENKSFADVIGDKTNAPYENALARRCGLALNYHDVSHPSLPNYIAATSGDTWGISDDADPDEHPLDVPSIYSQLDAAGLSWREYAENSPGGCPQDDAGRYAIRHDPVTYYTQVRAECSQWDLPLAELGSALASNTLPSFALVTPNVCHDTHDCPVRTGDDWLKSWLSRILASRAYGEGTTAVILVWDEAVNGSDHVPLIAIAPSVRSGTTSSGSFDHYSLLKTTQELLGLGVLGHEDEQSTASMVDAFHLLSS